MSEPYEPVADAARSATISAGPRPASTGPDAALAPEQPVREFWYRFTRSKPALVGLVFLVLVILSAIFAGFLAPYQPFSGGNDALKSPGFPGHLLGTNHLGQDVLSQLLHGSRVSLLVGFSVAFLSTLIGVVVGALAGFYGGWADSLLMRVAEFFQTMPRLVLALIIVALFGSSLASLIVVISILSWPQTARVVRTGVQTVRNAAFVDAARVAGMPAGAIIRREILPNVLASIVVTASLEVAGAILTEAALSFFGLGDPNFVSWGGMLFQAQAYLRGGWWMAVFPGSMIALVVLAFNVVGDGLNDALNPWLKERS